ncbi:glycosyltransferase [Endozoicomonas sp. SESOKO3]|uniref:glycosyltransferase n=2 Tax=unclassified Endozoicomonas TaxID=2644528 RepID=UPI00214867FF|nr:glycosyltransferase [Endozoicomonas sp. SESOKO3]
MSSITAIVPLGPGEPEWPVLLEQFSLLPAGSEIILVGYKDQQRPAKLDQLPPPLLHLKWFWCAAEQGRACQLNAGAREATGDYLWFLHADTILNKGNVQSLLNAINQHPERLFYFDLWFYDKHTLRLSINEWGARFRSNVLGCPYGDQGFCISRTQFLNLKGYPTNTGYGEDHVFVWKARQNKIHLHPCRTRLGTSARKYHERGWLNLTLKYQRLWLKQATPEFFKWLRIKPDRNRL